MATHTRICLSRSQWDRLESYLPEGICEKVTEPDLRDPIEDCRIIANEATYRAILAIAKVHCPDLVQAIEKEKHKSEIGAQPAQSPVSLPALAEARGHAELDRLESSIGRDDQSLAGWPATLVLTLVLIALYYLAFFARCMPLLTGQGRCQRLSPISEPVVIDPAGVSWSTFINTAGFVFYIFSVSCLLIRGAVWRETLRRPRLLRPVGTKLPRITLGSVEPLSVCGVVLLMVGLLLHVISLFLKL